MAVTFNAQSSGSVNPATTLTIAHTCSGSDRVLLVGISTNNTVDRITGVTYNGVSMTRLNSQVGSSGNFYSYLYYLQNPASGTNNIVVSASASSLIGAINASFSGAAQTSTPDNSASGTQTGAGTTISANVTVNTANSMLFGHCRGSDTLGAGTGTTSNGTLFSAAFISGYSTSTRSTGSQTLSFTRPSADTTLWLVASIAPATGASTQISSINGVAQASISSFNGVALASIASAMGVSNS